MSVFLERACSQGQCNQKLIIYLLYMLTVVNIAFLNVS